MKIKEILRKVQFPVMLALGTYPLVTCLLVFLAPQLLRYAWVFPGVYAAISALLLLLPGKPRVAVSICGVLLLTVPCGLFLQGMSRGICLAISLMYSAMLVWGLQLPGWEKRREISAGWLGTCLAIVLAGCFFAWFEVRLASVAAGIKLATLGFVLLAMLSLNRGSLNLAAGESRGFSPVMRRKNLLLTAGMFGIALLIALIPSMFGLLETLFNWILWLIRWLRDALASLAPAETTVETVTEATTVPPTTYESWMDVVLEDKKVYSNSKAVDIMMTAIVLVVVVPLVLVAVFKIGRLLFKGVRSLVELFDRATGIQQEEFHDEITDTRGDASLHRPQKKVKQKHGSVRAPGKMEPAQRIRYRYRRLQDQNPQWKDHYTARETLPEEAARLYERARYSDHSITEEEADRFQTETK